MLGPGHGQGAGHGGHGLAQGAGQQGLGQQGLGQHGLGQQGSPQQLPQLESMNTVEHNANRDAIFFIQHS